MRGFGRRGRGGRGGASQVPTKDELDAQLDAYNAKVYINCCHVKNKLQLPVCSKEAYIYCGNPGTEESSIYVALIHNLLIEPVFM